MALRKGRKMSRLQGGTPGQHSAAALFLLAALSCKSKNKGLKDQAKHFEAKISIEQTDFRAASLTDDGLSSELLSTRRRLAEAMNILVERKNQSRKTWSVSKQSSRAR